jgi:predicted DNA-binding transcriptional regulator AlpA
VKRKAFPKPVKLSRGINVWRVQDLRLLLDKLGEPTPP